MSFFSMIRYYLSSILHRPYIVTKKIMENIELKPIYTQKYNTPRICRKHDKGNTKEKKKEITWDEYVDWSIVP